MPPVADYAPPKTLCGSERLFSRPMRTSVWNLYFIQALIFQKTRENRSQKDRVPYLETRALKVISNLCQLNVLTKHTVKNTRKSNKTKPTNWCLRTTLTSRNYIAINPRHTPEKNNKLYIFRKRTTKRFSFLMFNS